MSDIVIPVSVGELLDKISILLIKSQRIHDPAKLKNIRRELDALNDVWAASGLQDDETRRLATELKSVNGRLWEIEDDIRDAEANSDFGPGFIALARSVYRKNDERAALKRAINEHSGSALIEEKSYRDYGRGEA
ncbi:MAG: DUF6165 family protein [Salinisphaera sp.]|nr:DUF6165 family protein [Salinisphaera sp.]